MNKKYELPPDCKAFWDKLLLNKSIEKRIIEDPDVISDYKIDENGKPILIKRTILKDKFK